MNFLSLPMRMSKLSKIFINFSALALAFSRDGKEIICGGSDSTVYIYDRDRDQRTLKVPVRKDSQVTDVNAVGFLDENLFYSGSDDACIRVWDRRCLNENNPEASGRVEIYFTSH